MENLSGICDGVPGIAAERHGLVAAGRVRLAGPLVVIEGGLDQPGRYPSSRHRRPRTGALSWSRQGTHVCRLAGCLELDQRH